MQAFREDKPVRFGDLVFNEIKGISFDRVHYNQYIADSEIEGGYARRRVSKFFKVARAKFSDRAGTDYLVNLARLSIATPDEVNVSTAVDRTLTNQLKLLDVFNAWCKEESLPPDTESLILFLFAEDLINAAKAYNIVKSFENSSTTP